MSRGIKLFMDIGRRECRDRDAYGSPKLSHFFSSFHHDDGARWLAASNSHHGENILNKCYLRGSPLPTMEKAALGASSKDPIPTDDLRLSCPWS